ncbi:MAG: sigma-E processing peptidase SpoIIGA [Oscillospiraceae bacterium]|nr:sigma-E processing peptidase SpoIIGA [Oscillospiraceae bacterium]
METVVYVDILLVTNYVINLLLVISAAKLAGRKSRGRRIVAAALLGAVSSLAIFLPLHGFFPMLALRLIISAGIVLAAFKWVSAAAYFREWLLFFAVTFCFGGAMLGVLLVFRPGGMAYYNGVVYFDIPAFMLIIGCTAAYLLFELCRRFAKKNILRGKYYRVTVQHSGGAVSLTGLMDTGNSLYEPFSGAPVIVAPLERISPVLPPDTAAALAQGNFTRGESCGMELRAVPCGHVGGNEILPAFIPHKLVLTGIGGEKRYIEQCYIAVSNSPIGDDKYSVLLHPGMDGPRRPPSVNSVIDNKHTKGSAKL